MRSYSQAFGNEESFVSFVLFVVYLPLPFLRKNDVYEKS